MNTQKLIADKMAFNKEDKVEVNALELIELVVSHERLERAFNQLMDKFRDTEAAMSIYKQRSEQPRAIPFVDLRA